MDSISLCLPLIIRSCGILPLMRSRHWRNVKVGSAWLIQSHCSRVSELYSRTLGSENGHLCSLILASEDHGHFETHCRIIENHGTLETQSPSTGLPGKSHRFFVCLLLRYSLLLHLLGSGDFTLPLNWTGAFVINPSTCIWTLYPTHLFICLRPIAHCLNDCGFIVCLEISSCKSCYSVPLFRDLFGHYRSFAYRF